MSTTEDKLDSNDDLLLLPPSAVVGLERWFKGSDRILQNHDRRYRRSVGGLFYFCDRRRHLVCEPYSVQNLHVMADELMIKRCWFHGGKHPHYDIPQRRIDVIRAKCHMVSTRQLVTFIVESLYASELQIAIAKAKGRKPSVKA